MVLPASERQLEILFGMLCGMTDKQIAIRMGCSLKTLKRHKREVLALYQARRTNQLLAGLLPPQLRLRVHNRLAEYRHVRQAAEARRGAARGSRVVSDTAPAAPPAITVTTAPQPSRTPAAVPPVVPTMQLVLVNAGRVQRRPSRVQGGNGNNHGNDHIQHRGNNQPRDPGAPECTQP